MGQSRHYTNLNKKLDTETSDANLMPFIMSLACVPLMSQIKKLLVHVEQFQMYSKTTSPLPSSSNEYLIFRPTKQYFSTYPYL